jgi:hypothetical protein
LCVLRNNTNSNQLRLGRVYEEQTSFNQWRAAGVH